MSTMTLEHRDPVFAPPAAEFVRIGLDQEAIRVSEVESVGVERDTIAGTACQIRLRSGRMIQALGTQDEVLAQLGVTWRQA